MQIINHLGNKASALPEIEMLKLYETCTGYYCA
jgi:hypothetical protein